MIVRRTRVLYRTKLFHGLRTLAGHHFHRSRTRLRRLFLTLVAGVLHVVRGSFRFGLRLRIVHFAGFAHFAGFEGLVGFTHFVGFVHFAGFAHFVGFALFVGVAAFVRRPTQYGLLRLRRQRTAFRGGIFELAVIRHHGGLNDLDRSRIDAGDFLELLGRHGAQALDGPDSAFHQLF